ncbi:MAG TPA: hypothetical protein PLO43_05710 [Chlamydiales bacterium]|nr:hypothetical protein [Chlamydiales bacterium]
MFKARHSNLIDTELSSPLPEDLVGATYRFETPEGPFIFAIRARQANAPEDNAPWEMWFGPMQNAQCSSRYSEVCEWIADQSKSGL